MQTPTLPSIKHLLDTPINDVHGSSFNFPLSHSSSPLTPISSYHSSFPSLSPQSTDAHHLAAINAHNKNMSLPSHNINIKSLLSPPESPNLTQNYQQSPLESYETQHTPKQELRYSLQQVSGEQCSCCARPSSDDYSLTSMQMNSYHNQYSQSIQQRYPYSTNNPLPISPFDRKQTTGSTLPRLNTSVFTNIASSKHFPQKSLNNQASQSSSSCGNRYQCPYCSKRFSRPSSLRIHTYSHTGEKPFVCSEPGCGRKFSVQSNMRRHLRVHRLGRPVKRTRYDGEVEGVKMLNHTPILRGCY
ncbi:c2h2 finger domain protein [Gigaspora margarita]|uniref:C2h2 finger domain protein n=1 Tax=Gigaspora margarita TaxID=4874 RepID=A0A8H3ZXI2_GIGMA|nr:c2h2 finger domain protein [Gigaspora margarita]